MKTSSKKKAAGWSHLDERNNPAMVDISDKKISQRMARARAELWLPPAVAKHLRQGDIQAPKGSVFHTAILAGTMAAKQTASLIPFCHPLPLDGIRINLEPRAGGILRIEAWVKATHKTGVEMEALTAVTVAALTVFDMCKVFSSAMEIRKIGLLEKRGGKKDYVSQG